jgi:ssDNA-binding Zn-finger/Zn-ribbon topoisomerase 1
VTAKNSKGKPICPACQSPMKLRTAKKGSKPGSKFWGCSRFPKCKAKRALTSDPLGANPTLPLKTKRKPLSKGYQSKPYLGENAGRGVAKDDSFLKKMGLHEVKHVDSSTYAPKLEKNHPLKYIDEGIAGTREDNKRSRAQNFFEIRKRNSE